MSDADVIPETHNDDQDTAEGHKIAIPEREDWEQDIRKVVEAEQPPGKKPLGRGAAKRANVADIVTDIS